MVINLSIDRQTTKIKTTEFGNESQRFQVIVFG
jgi:hypothetical protein